MSIPRAARVWTVPMLLIAAMLGWLLTKEGAVDRPPQGEAGIRSEQTEEPEGEFRQRFLVGYADQETTPQEDMMKIFDVLEAFQNAIKIPGALPTGENREVVRALLGDNPHRRVFIEEGFGHLNADGELLDRWMTPVFFHFVEAGDVGIRSAGPDGVMWNTDDVVYGDHAGELK